MMQDTKKEEEIIAEKILKAGVLDKILLDISARCYGYSKGWCFSVVIQNGINGVSSRRKPLCYAGSVAIGLIPTDIPVRCTLNQVIVHLMAIDIPVLRTWNQTRF